MKLRTLAGVGAALLATLLVVGWLIFFRGDAAVSVDSEEAATARQSALDAADSTADGSIDGSWTVDTSIGTFGPECLDDVCSASFVGFRIDEQLAGVGAKTVVGRSPGVAGSLELDDRRIVAAEVVVDMTALVTDDRGRDAAMKGQTGGLETLKFPEASFILTEPIELGASPSEGLSVSADAVGDLTVHGVTKSVVVPLEAELGDGVIVVFGSLSVPLADFDIPTPTAIVVLGIDDVATMELQLFFTR